MQNTEEIWRLVDAKQTPFTQLSDRVWGMPELCYGEFRSCAEHTAMLEQAWNEKRGAFTVAFGSDDLDASVLLLPELGAVEPTDPTTARAQQGRYLLRARTCDASSCEFVF